MLAPALLKPGRTRLQGKLGAAGTISRGCVHMCPRALGTFTGALPVEEDGPQGWVTLSSSHPRPPFAGRPAAGTRVSTEGLWRGEASGRAEAQRRLGWARVSARGPPGLEQSPQHSPRWGLLRATQKSRASHP